MAKKINVSVVGGTGYTGIELLRILSQHPLVKINHITSRSDHGKSVADVYPSLRAVIQHKFIDPDKANLADNDLVFFATPNGIAMKYTEQLLSNNVKVIDLAADFRIPDVSLWEQWYGMQHECKHRINEAVYGLPEVNRKKIKTANLVANPVCYPTAIQLGLLPLIEKNLIETNNIIADAKSGISGAGRKNEPAFLMSEASESFRAYAVHGHRHTPEIESQLSVFSGGKDIKLTFVPHLVPMVRGIHATLYVECLESFDPYLIFNNFYKNEPFVDVLEDKQYPDTKSVRASNLCRISLHKIPNSKRLIILSVIDNLVKGAAGQAVQNMNIMMGCEETAGLDYLVPLVP